jgi:hypothetical protein
MESFSTQYALSGHWQEMEADVRRLVAPSKSGLSRAGIQFFG